MPHDTERDYFRLGGHEKLEILPSGIILQEYQLIKNVIKNYRTWQKRKHDIAQLQALTDRDLADIGIRRYDIERVVYGMKAPRD